MEEASFGGHYAYMTFASCSVWVAALIRFPAGWILSFLCCCTTRAMAKQSRCHQRRRLTEKHHIVTTRRPASLDQIRFPRDLPAAAPDDLPAKSNWVRIAYPRELDFHLGRSSFRPPPALRISIIATYVISYINAFSFSLWKAKEAREKYSHCKREKLISYAHFILFRTQSLNASCVTLGCVRRMLSAAMGHRWRASVAGDK